MTLEKDEIIKNDKLDTFYGSMVESFDDLEEKEIFPKDFYKAFLAGENVIYQKTISEKKIFDEKWIETIESYFGSIDKITRLVRSGLRYDDEIVAIEKAKKVNSQSVRHLSSHSQYVKEIKDDGFVIPNKILTQQAEIDYGIYENRFMKTLINRLYKFVDKRVNVIRENIDSYKKKHFNLDSKFEFKGSEVTMNLDLVLKEDLDNKKVNADNRKILERAEKLYKLIGGLKRGQFMELMKSHKEVKAPIMKTQVILKNVDFRNAYLLWIYLDKYNTLGFDIEVKEKNMVIDEDYMKDIHRAALTTFSTVAINQEKRKLLYESIKDKIYRKKSIKQINENIDDVKRPDKLEMEHNAVNEYYLEKSKELFKQNYKKHQEEGSTKEISLKRALRDTIDITNSLYESFFDLAASDDDFDVFRSLVENKKDAKEEVSKAQKKAFISKMIRETKEVDYNRAIKLEKKWLDNLSEANKNLNEKQKQDAKSESKLVEINRRKAYNKKLTGKQKQMSEEKADYVRDQKNKMEQYRKEVTAQIKKEKEHLDKYEKTILDKARAKAKKEYLEKIRRLEEREKREKQKLREHMAIEKRRDRLKLLELEKKVRDASKKNIALGKNKILDRHARALEEAREAYRKKYGTI